ncbi:LuxR C-terminal-related transcriptional regulator [Microvirga splendida]|uniref:Response regulator transcription factor n=1 Tax=Microvirga splendida TaxID=2795727 RepID=A0ABS0XUQ4_9HYPH|nr:response regulator transcription factor [Microvirga splendida]
MALGAILTRRFGFSDVIEVGSLDEALERLSEETEISVALFDLSMPGLRSPTSLRAVRECFPQTQVAVVSGSSSRRDMLLALEAGVHGYMLKSLSISELTTALEAVFNGGIYVPPSLADFSSDLAEKMKDVAPSFEQGDMLGQLTPRQQDVLDLLVQGKTNKEIALALGLGEGTVKIHMAAIFRYFGVNNRAAAAVAGARPHLSRQHL